MSKQFPGGQEPPEKKQALEAERVADESLRQTQQIQDKAQQIQDKTQQIQDKTAKGEAKKKQDQTMALNVGQKVEEQRLQNQALGIVVETEKQAEAATIAAKKKARQTAEEEHITLTLTQKAQDSDEKRREDEREQEAERQRIKEQQRKAQKQLEDADESAAEEEEEEDEEKTDTETVTVDHNLEMITVKQAMLQEKLRREKMKQEYIRAQAFKSDADSRAAYKKASIKKSAKADSEMQSHLDNIPAEGIHGTQYWYNKTKKARNKALDRADDRGKELEIRKNELLRGERTSLIGRGAAIKTPAEIKVQEDRIISKVRSIKLERTVHELYQALPGIALKTEDPKITMAQGFGELQKIHTNLKETHNAAKAAEKGLTSTSRFGKKKRELSKNHLEASVVRKRDAHASANAIITKNLREGGKEDGAVIDYTVKVLKRTNEQLSAADNAYKLADKYGTAAKEHDLAIVDFRKEYTEKGKKEDTVRKNFEESLTVSPGITPIQRIEKSMQNVQGYNDFELGAHQTLRKSNEATKAREQMHAMAADTIKNPNNVVTLKERTNAFEAANVSLAATRNKLEDAESKLRITQWEQDPGKRSASRVAVAESVQDYQNDYERDNAAMHATFSKTGDSKDLTKDVERLTPSRFERLKAWKQGREPQGKIKYLSEYKANAGFLHRARNERNANRVAAVKLGKQHEAQVQAADGSPQAAMAVQQTHRQIEARRADYLFSRNLLASADSADPKKMKEVKETYKERSFMQRLRDKWAQKLAAAEKTQLDNQNKSLLPSEQAASQDAVQNQKSKYAVVDVMMQDPVKNKEKFQTARATLKETQKKKQTFVDSMKKVESAISPGLLGSDLTPAQREYGEKILRGLKQDHERTSAQMQSQVEDMVKPKVQVEELVKPKVKEVPKPAMVVADKDKKVEQAAPEKPMPKEEEEEKRKAETKYGSEKLTTLTTATDIAATKPGESTKPGLAADLASKPEVPKPAPVVAKPPSVPAKQKADISLSVTVVKTQDSVAPSPMKGIPKPDEFASRLTQVGASTAMQQKGPESMAPSKSDVAKVAAATMAANTGAPTANANTAPSTPLFQRFKEGFYRFFGIRQSGQAEAASTPETGVETPGVEGSEKKRRLTPG